MLGAQFKDYGGRRYRAFINTWKLMWMQGRTDVTRYLLWIKPAAGSRCANGEGTMEA
jgi:hypothetical protein